MNMPGCRQVTVLGRTSSPDEVFHLLRLENPGWTYVPGQFLMLRPHWGLDPIWARPFSICQTEPGEITIFFQVVGRGTKRLAGVTPGETVTIWGPLGRGFFFGPDEDLLVLAGGMGLAPFVGLIKNHGRPGRIRLIFGHRAPLEVYPWQELAAVCRAESMLQKTDEDIRGFVRVLRNEIEAFGIRGRVLACGPEPFLRQVQTLCLRSGASGQISLENRMACGVGACLGCVARNGQGHMVQTCLHGPVFDVNDVQLSEAP